jgi:hypothetical protein
MPNRNINTPAKRRSKPKKYIPGTIDEYILERDRFWWKSGTPELKQALKEKYKL